MCPKKNVATMRYCKKTSMHNYYHITPIENLEKIAAQGLLPMTGPRSSLLAEKEAAIYVFSDLTAVEDACNNWLADCFDEDQELALLRITTPEAALPSPGAEYESTLFQIVPFDYICILSHDLFGEVSISELDSSQDEHERFSD